MSSPCPRAIAPYSLVAILLLGALVGACDETPTCVDQDGDGYGEGCENGADCNDHNAARNIRCDGPPPDCDGNPTLTGCPCLGGVSPCFDGTQEQSGVGECQAGQTICINGFWGLCNGSVPPVPEFCDGLDHDCDGLVDEGVTSPCGGCTPGCFGGVWGEGDSPFVATSDTALTPRGYLTLPSMELTHETVWVANSGEDTLSRIDAGRLEEVGRYRTGISPSRVAVDYHGDAWVVSRGFEVPGAIHLVAGDDARCVDRDESGSLTTSRDATPVDDDECILRGRTIGEANEVPRAIAIDGNRGLEGQSGGDLWVGMHDGQRILHIDGLSMEVLDTIPTPDFSPYAFAFDSSGVLWGISRDGHLLSLDRYNLAAGPTIRAVPLACFQLYGLAIDGQGRVALTGFGCDSVTIYDPIADHYTTVETPQSVRGAVTAGEALFVAHTFGAMSRLTIRPLALEQTTRLGNGIESIGIGATSNHVWIASSRGHESGVGLVAAVRRFDGTLEAEIPVGVAPHTQGDLTGAKRRAQFGEEGRARHIFRGCNEGETTWGDMRVNAQLGGGRITINARHAANESALSDAPFSLVGEAQAGETRLSTRFPAGGVVEVEAHLVAGAADSAPQVRRVGLEWNCPGPM